MIKGEMTIGEYAEILRQIFHQAKESPQILTMAASKLTGKQRHMISMMYRHALSEMGHDALAMKDLEALEVNCSQIMEENPLPATLALTSTAYAQILMRNPVGYLGYVFYLEYMPVLLGAQLKDGLVKCNIPPQAMKFLADHVQIDVAHNKIMKMYAEVVVQNEEDLDCVKYAIHWTADLYGQMIDDAVTNANSTVDYGMNEREQGYEPRAAS